MSTVSLPTYFGPLSLGRALSYSSDVHNAMASAQRYLSMSSGSFVKQSKGVILRLDAQEDNVGLPVYRSGSHVEGTVGLSKTNGVESVEVKIEGRLMLKEIAGSGTSSANLCLNSAVLWPEHTESDKVSRCPYSLPFSLAFPNTFHHEGVTYPLPPSFNVKLSGIPGFTATIEYSVTAIVVKTLSMPMATLRVKSLGLHFGTTAVSTTIVYYPRSRPAKPLPAPLGYLETIFEPYKPTSEWELHSSTLHSRVTAKPDLVIKLYLPSLRAFSITEPIPFYLTVESTTSVALASFLPYSPTGNSQLAHKVTRIQMVRQSTVDVRHSVMELTKGEMWTTDCIGEGTFSHVGDGHTWMSYSGKIDIDKKVKVVGFRAAGLCVKDYIVFSITPLDMSKSAFQELREVIPVRLTTDSWSSADS